jgi:hypothetical protein
MLRIRQAASHACFAFKDAKDDPSGYAAQALRVIADVQGVFAVQELSPAMFSVLESKETKAFNSLMLSGYMADF